MVKRRIAVWSAVGIALAGALALGLRSPAVVVESAAVARGPMQVTIEEEGVTRVSDRYLVSTPVAGFVRRSELDVGDVVEAGDVLGQLEPLRSTVLDARSRAEARARLASAESALAAAKEHAAALEADARHAEVELESRSKLAEKNMISADELSLARAAHDRAEALLRSARFAVDVAQHEREAASTYLKYSAAQSTDSPAELVSIRSPVSGRVLRLYQESEGVVQAGTPLVEVGDPAALEIAVDVLSFDAVRLQPGARVRIARWGGDDIEGRLRLVEPVGFTRVSALGVEEQRVWVIVDIVSPRSAWESLGDGYRVEASFVLWESDSVLQVPNAALFRADGGHAVFVIEGSSVTLRAVEIGERNGLVAQVIKGLQEGNQVVSHPDSRLEAGSRIKLRDRTVGPQ